MKSHSDFPFCIAIKFPRNTVVKHIINKLLNSLMGTKLWCWLNLQNCGLSEMNVENEKRRCYALYNQTPKAVAQGTVPSLRGVPESFPSGEMLTATSAVYLWLSRLSHSKQNLCYP